MKPLPETVAALNEFARYGDDEPGIVLDRMGRAAESLVPDLVGLSVSLLEENITLTLAASSEEIAVLDAFQYLDGGPCEHAVAVNEVVPMSPAAALDEDVWTFYARSTAAAGVGSTLSLPVLDRGRVVGGVNMYAVSGDAFDGKEEALADALGAAAAGAVKNADVPFDTRREAAAASERLASLDAFSRVVGILVEARGLRPEEARERIADAAARAGIEAPLLARAISSVLRPGGPEEGA